MYIKPLEKHYACIDRYGNAALDTVSRSKQDSISKFMKNATGTWTSQRDIGWRCIKLNIKFEEVPIV